ncbi:purine/pyrimidine permease [Paenibacillus sp. y28]|uniref:purine/pyrimidine permease n=1 Tax=Paenibacillus sp. y28 TaxID=3129110 RepID=UPI003017053D
MNKQQLRDCFGTLQWFIFLLANSVALPIVIGSVFQLSADEIASLLQRTFFVVGVSSLLQGWIGHRLPLAEGPAGSWVSVFVMIAGTAVHKGQDMQEALQFIQGGLLTAGIVLLVLGLTGLMRRLLALFTPLVTGTFLFILALQLSGVFIKGMAGIQGNAGQPDYGTALIAFGVFFLVILISMKGFSWLKNYAVLTGILAGWAVFALLGKQPPGFSSGGALLQLPEVWAWGMPRLESGVLIMSMLFTLTLVSNSIAAVSAVQQVAPDSKLTLEKAIDRGGIGGGISHLLASTFSSVGIVPLPVSAGFIRLTQQSRRLPFLIACAGLVAISLAPGLVRWLALLPGPVANAVLMASLVQMIILAFQSLLKDHPDQRKLTIFGMTLLLSIGLMSFPAEAFAGLPSVLQYIAGNSLLFGTMLVIILDRLWKPAASGPHREEQAVASR